MKKYTFDDIRKNGWLLYEYVRGSVAYGTNTPESDEDHGGVYLEPIDQVLGLGLDFQDEISDEKHDTTWYSLKKYLTLLLSSNPNILESLFIDDKFVIYEHPIITELKKHRQEFVTKQCFNSFLGYAVAQVKRARGYNKLCVNPVTERKEPIDFCFTPYKQGSSCMREWLAARGLEQKYCGLVSLNNMPDTFGVYYDFGAHNHNKYKTYREFLNDEKYVDFCDRNGVFDGYSADEDWFEYTQTPIGYRGIVKDYGVKIPVSDVANYQKIDSTPIIAVIDGEYYFRDEDTKVLTKAKIIEEDGIKYLVNDINKSDTVRCSSIPKGEEPICIMTYNKDGFTQHCNKYHQYQEWVQKRNKVRYESNLGHNYDCYLDEETEFLTKEGWKKYDEITKDDLIATFDNTHTIKWEHYLDRYDNIYSGPMYTLETAYTRCTVTPNHKMHISHCPRNPKTGFKCLYKEGVNKWENVPINEWLSQRKGYYFIVNNLQNLNPDNPEYTDDELLVLGYFLSDGSIGYNNKKNPYISISQLKKTKGFPLLHELSNKGILREYSHERKGRLEYDFHCTDKHILSMVNDCIINGHYSFQKTLPQFAFDLSKRQFDILLKGMLMGDGTFHKKGHSVYYTTSKQMASDLHTLLTINGYNSELYGKKDSSYDKAYESSFTNKNKITYQVFISKNNSQFKIFAKRRIGTYNNKNCGYEINEVKNKRIVCFTTQSGNLVTRNKNKIAFHGNSKNVSHCFRLINMGLEIAKTGKVQINRTGIDADFLLDIRNHKYEYEYLIKELENKKEELDKAVANSTLPEAINIERVNQMLLDIRYNNQLYKDVDNNPYLKALVEQYYELKK